ncbi:MAG: long-chain fatty acid--CoA ligase [Desulfobacterales bacterium]
MEKFIDFENVHAMLRQTVDRRGKDPAYRWIKGDSQTEEVTWEEFRVQVRQVAKSLIAHGVQKDDKVAIVSYSCYRWVLADLAAVSIGAATVGIYQTLPTKDCRYIIQHSDAVLVFVQDRQQLDKLLEIRKEISGVRHVVPFSGDSSDDDWSVGFGEFIDKGRNVSDSTFAEMAAAVRAQDVAAIVYTSGTTGVPKGAMLTHDNLTFTAQSVEKSVLWHPDDQVFLFLPLAHVFARTCVYTALLTGCTLTFNRSMDTLAEDLKTTRPHWFPSVPRIYEKVQAKIINAAEAKGGLALKIFRWALAVGYEFSGLRLKHRPVPPLVALRYKIAHRLVFAKIQAALGGRVRWCISGAAPLNPEVGRFFHAAGILIVEGIGMTENTSFSNLNRYDNYRFGWVGPPGPGIEQKTAPDGEILFRGRNVMKGYYKMPEDTAATMTADGWLKTGDLGEIDAEGFLRITGRKKEILVTSGGKNIGPAAIEAHLATSRFIHQVCVVGDRRNYLTALITLEPEAISAYAAQQGLVFNSSDDPGRHPAIHDLIETEIAAQNQFLAPFETIKKFTIVPEFTMDNGMLTPTLKLRKNVILNRFSDSINSMYG